MLNIVTHLVLAVQLKSCSPFTYALESAHVMTAKDERIGFRVSSQVKHALMRIAKREGRSLAQICELLLRGGIRVYEKEGPKYLQELIERKVAREP
jgi:hypothetical protein